MQNDEEAKVINLLIVDDEPGIVESLHTLCTKRFAKAGVFVIRAYSSDEVIQIMQKTCIDLLLSDIRMPKINGIMLANWVEKYNPMCKIIFLTGYRSFDYAREAVQNRCVVDFLLKSSEDEVLLQTLDKHIRLCIELQHRKLSADEINHMVQQKVQLLPDFWWKTSRYNNILYETKYVLNRPIWLLWVQCQKNKESTVIAHFESLFYVLIRETMAQFECIGYTMHQNDGYVFYLQVTNDEILQNPHAYLRSRLELLKTRIRYIQNVAAFIYTEQGYMISELTERIKKLSDIAYIYRESRETILVSDHSEMMKNQITEFAGKQMQLIRKIHQIIEKNISDPNFSLDIIAEKTFYSTAYISRIFRKQTGKRIIDYINELRISKSKVLLQGGMRVSDVAHEVGFRSLSYFSSFFKKNVGMTPGDYQRNECDVI